MYLWQQRLTSVCRTLVYFNRLSSFKLLGKERCKAGRTKEEVREIIKTAKLHESELRETSQIISYAEHDPSYENLRLMQLDEHLLSEIMSGNEVVFKGDPEESVVLCTATRTYDVKESETSNSLLLMPDLLFAADTKSDKAPEPDKSIDSENSFDKSNNSLNTSTETEVVDCNRRIENKEIVKTFFMYYELRLCKPRVNKLRKLLEQTKYSGKENEYAIDRLLLFTHEDLLNCIQASQKELDEALHDIQAIPIEGHYRVLEFDYEFRVLSYMLDLIDENSWPLDMICRETTMDSLKDLVPREILDGLFSFYTEESVMVSKQYYRYKVEKVCRFLARVLLRSAGKFNLAEFMQAWKDSVPEGMVAEENMLAGIALIDKDSTPQVVWGFSQDNLPEDIHQRFRLLFQTKPKWTVEQIAPYIECFATEKMNVNALLTKYARASTQNGVRLYSAKHSK